MTFMSAHMKRALENLTPWATYEKSLKTRLEEGLGELTIDEASEESSRSNSTFDEDAVGNP